MLPKFEQYWSKKCDKSSNVHTVNTKNHFIKLLDKYGYKVSDEIVEIEGGKRLYSVYVNQTKDEECIIKKQDQQCKTN